jgi:hypothetical protein
MKAMPFIVISDHLVAGVFVIASSEGHPVIFLADYTYYSR